MGEKGSRRMFTDRAIQALKPDPYREYMKVEPGGLGIRVRPNGSKTWVHVYTWNGKQRAFTIGKVSEISLADARADLGKIRRKLAKGISPHEERKTARVARANTIGELAEKFMREHAIPKLQPKTVREYGRELKVYVLPRWGNRPIMDITPADVRGLIKTVAEENGPILSNRLYSLLRKLFVFAQEEYLRDDNPVASIRRLHSERSRDRILSESEIRNFWNGIESSPVPEEIRRILKFALVTAMRTGEITSSRWEHIDGQVLTLPTTKGGRRHQVPLSNLALEIAGPRKEIGLIFPRPTGNQVYVEDVAKYVRRNLTTWGTTERWTPHDLRRTTASKMTEIGISRLVVSKILGHAEPGVTAIYDRTSYLPEMRKAMERWSRYLRTLIGDSEAEEKVVPIKGPSS